MPPEKTVTSETQDQSIKSRKNQLFEADAAARAEHTSTRKSFQQYLKETPAAPMPPGTKAFVGIVGLVVVLQLVGAVVIQGKSTKLTAATAVNTNYGKGGTKKSPLANAGRPGGSSSDVGVDMPLAKKAKDDEETKKKEEEKEKSKWAVIIDSPSRKLELADGQEAIEIGVPSGNGFNGRVLYPATPSPFVIVGENRGEKDVRQVWDLKAKKPAGSIRGAQDIRDPFAAGPDGTFFAAGGWNDKGDLVHVWNLKDKKEWKIPLPAAWLAFAGKKDLVVALPGYTAFQVWSMDKGKKAKEFEVEGTLDPGSLAISPGGKYLAFLCPSDSVLRVYDLEEEEIAGEAELPKTEEGDLTCAGMAFSPDGEEVAAVFGPKRTPRVVCWEVESGKVAADVKVEDLGERLKDVEYQGSAVEWVPDRSGWLLFGYALIDRESSRPVWSLPVTSAVYPASPRRMVDASRVLLVTGQPAGRGIQQTLREVRIPKDRLTTAVKSAREGRSPLDSLLPPAKPADLLTIKTPPAGNDGAPGKLKSPAQAKKTLDRPIEASTSKTLYFQIQKILCSSPEAPQALIVCRDADTKNSFGSVVAGGELLWGDRYDLASGKYLGKVDLPAVSDVIAFSPDGTGLLMRDQDRGERLDLFSTADSKPLLGWRPYDKEPEADREVAWAAFTDAKHVLTLSTAGKLMLWVVPDGRATFAVADAFKGKGVLSPARDAVLGPAGNEIRFFDTATGRKLGKVAAPAPIDPDSFAADVRSDGESLAALLGATLVTWDLKTGKDLASLTSSSAGDRLEWCNPSLLLAGDRSLIDLKAQGEVWRYRGGKHAVGSPEGHHWVAVEPYQGKPAYLMDLPLPDKAYNEMASLTVGGKGDVMFKPGDTISLKIEGAKAPGDQDAFRAAVTETLTQKLKANDIGIADGLPVSLVVKFDEIDRPRAIDFQRVMIPPPSEKEQSKDKKPETLKALVYEISVIDSKGASSLDKQEIGPFDIDFSGMPGKYRDAMPFVRYKIWELATKRIGEVDLPAYAARRKGQAARFPGFRDLDQIELK
jgi:hypothetical protein